MGMPSAAAALDVASSPSECASRCIAMGATRTGHAIFLPAGGHASCIDFLHFDPLAADVSVSWLRQEGLIIKLEKRSTLSQRVLCCLWIAMFNSHSNSTTELRARPEVSHQEG